MKWLDRRIRRVVQQALDERTHGQRAVESSALLNARAVEPSAESVAKRLSELDNIIHGDDFSCSWRVVDGIRRPYFREGLKEIVPHLQETVALILAHLGVERMDVPGTAPHAELRPKPSERSEA